MTNITAEFVEILQIDLSIRVAEEAMNDKRCDDKSDHAKRVCDYGARRMFATLWKNGLLSIPEGMTIDDIDVRL